MSHQPNNCELCKRETALTRHHLIPRTLHARKHVRRSFSREELHGLILWVCRSCHSRIHSTFTEMELAGYYHSRERLLENSEIAITLRDTMVIADNSGIPGYEALGYDWVSTDRAVIIGNDVHYVHGDRVWSAGWGKSNSLSTAQ